MGLQQTSICYDRDLTYRHYFLCNYLPGSAGRDSFSESLLKFKRGQHPDLEAWIDCSLEESARIPIGRETVILRPLHHMETTIDPMRPASLDLLGDAMAERFGCLYRPTLLSRSGNMPEIKWLGREQRISALRGAYRLTGELPGGTGTQWLVLDDIVTTGATMNAVMESLMARLSPFEKPSLLAFSLAKAGYDPSLNLFNRLQGRNYQLEQGASWLAEEGPAGYIPEYSVQTLKNWILQDAFPHPSP